MPELLRAKSENKCIEMIWFGGIGNELSDTVMHATLHLKYSETELYELEHAHLVFKPLRNRANDIVKLKCRDRFFYNQELYLRKPTKILTEMGLGYTGRYQSKFFNKNRYIAVIGREAFHVFDLNRMEFIYADLDSGYKNNIDKEVYNLD